MQKLTLTWRFVLEQQASPWLVPEPWHLLAVLFLLGVLAAIGLHHLLGYTRGLYMVKGRPVLYLALPSLAVLLVSVQLLLAAYLIGVDSKKMAGLALGEQRAFATVGVIGRTLLEAGLGPVDEVAAGEEVGSKGRLTEILLAVPEEEIREGLLNRLERVKAELKSVDRAASAETEMEPPPADAAEMAEVEAEAEPPPQPDAGETAEAELSAEPSAETEAAPTAEEAAKEGGSQSDPPSEPAESSPGEANGEEIAGDSEPLPEEPAGEAESSPDTAVPETAITQAEPPLEPPAGEVDYSRPLLILALQWASKPGQSWPEEPGGGDEESTAEENEAGEAEPAAAEGEDEEAGEQSPTEEPGEEEQPSGGGFSLFGPDETFPLPVFLVSLVDEIREEAILARQDWEHVAGSRFIERVLEPLLEEQLFYSALLLLVLTLLANTGTLYLMVLLRRRLLAVPPPPAVSGQANSPPK